MRFNATIVGILNAIMAMLSVVAAASWGDVIDKSISFYIVTFTLSLNAGLHTLSGAAILIGGNTNGNKQ
jgi:hypothetical protein